MKNAVIHEVSLVLRNYMAAEIQKIEQKVQNWFATNEGHIYKDLKGQELLFVLEQKKVLSPIEIKVLKTVSLFNLGKKEKLSETLPLEGWGIERETKKK